jgi:hypothetical protein
MMEAARPAVEEADAHNKGLFMRMFLIVAVAVVVGIVLGYAVMTTYYGASAPASGTMMRK